LAGERGLDSEALGVDWTGGGYSAEELGELPGAVGAASLGCGNPTALATLSPGEVVLDLGSGGGIDVLLSARRVSPGGKAYGLDMRRVLFLCTHNSARSQMAEGLLRHHGGRVWCDRKQAAWKLVRDEGLALYGVSAAPS
jgi:hypothetical protein